MQTLRSTLSAFVIVRGTKDVADANKDQLEGPIALGTLPTIGPYLLPQFPSNCRLV